MLIARERPYLQCVREHFGALHSRLASIDRLAAGPMLGHWPDVMPGDYVFQTRDQ